MLKYLFVVSVLSVLSAAANGSQYGGWSGLSGKKTGFFYVEQLDGRWWCIDPTGAAFFAIGTDHVNYNVHWCEALGYAPYAQNIRKKYNNDESAWAKSATDRLKRWNFNVLGANNSPSTRGRGLTYMEFTAMGSDYAGKDGLVEKVYWTGFPNVFNPAFAEFCRQKAEKECAPAKDDPWLFGWFIDNELEWFGKGGGDVGIATEAIKLPATHEAKKALVELLKGKYADIGKSNSAWGTSFGSWEDALNSTAWNEKANEKVTADKLEFVRLCADRYFAITTDAIRKADPNHMIIGCRFAGNAPPIWGIAGKYCDIVSLNYYGQVDLGTLKPINLVEDLTRWHKDAKRPLMLTEWSFPALDAGLPSKHGAGMRVRTQADKAKCFEVYQKTFFRLPFMVGSDYFMWVDEPALGIAKTFPEDSNYGLVDVNDEPWKLFTEAVTRVNAQAYQIHSGKTSELSIESPDPRTLKIRNTGIVSAKTSLSIRIDGKDSEWTVSVPARGESIVEADVPPGVHYLEAAVDPEGKLVEVNRGDNRLTKMVYVSEGAASKGKAVIGVLASSQSVVSIPVSRLPKGSIRLMNSAGKEIEAEVFDLDGSGTITPADELVFQAEPGKQPETLYVDSGPSTIKLVTPKSVQSFDLSGKLRLAKNTGSGTAIDLVEMGGIHMGSFEVLMQQVAGGTWWQRPNKVKSIRLWEGSLVKRVEVSVSNTDRGDGAGPFAYDATYAFEFYPHRHWFTARFLSLTNTDSRPWTLGSYFYYPLSAIGGDSKDDDADPPGAGGVAAWTNSKIGAAYGIITRPSSGVQVYFWKDEAGGEHSDARAQIDKPLKPGETCLGKTPPAYIFCASTKHDPQPWRSIELGIESLPKWEVFKP